MFYSDLGEIAISALRTGNSLQSEVRNAIKDGSLSTAQKIIITAVEELKSWSEAEIEEKGDVSLRKQTNNLINDISRICRESIGYSLRCKAKKPQHKYVMEPYNAPEKGPKPAPKVKPETTADTITNMEIEDEAIAHLVKMRPVSVMAEVFRVYGDDPENLKAIFTNAKEFLDKQG